MPHSPSHRTGKWQPTPCSARCAGDSYYTTWAHTKAPAPQSSRTRLLLGTPNRHGRHSARRSGVLSYAKGACLRFRDLGPKLMMMMMASTRFFVWRGRGKAAQPFYVWDKAAPVVLLAGLYDVVDSPEGTFTLLYHADNAHPESLSPIVLDDPAALSTWLDTRSQTWGPSLEQLMNPATSIYNFLSSYQVHPRIERERSSSPTMIHPISQRKDGIVAAFARQTARSAPSQTPTEPPARLSSPAHTVTTHDTSSQHDEPQPVTQPSQGAGSSTQSAASAPPGVPLRPRPVTQRAEPKRRGTRGSAKRGAPSRRGKRAHSRTPPQTAGPPAKRTRVQGAPQARDPSVEIVERPTVQAARESSPDIVEIPPPAWRTARANPRAAEAAGPSRAVGASTARPAGARVVERASSAPPSVMVASAAPSPSPPHDAKVKGKEPVRSRRGAA
ncbi:hypothetical protein PsYK624_119870 [Phanerochaete sordida]|uniref:DUF159-domain-containing protein n=1 Tax=Phanerochaete sordida TaxID=48140 RepID=A0A9P3LIL5_9APHY|nr:hypothetical protein PsYK624_119870 [Phanerochaete sordida]